MKRCGTLYQFRALLDSHAGRMASQLPADRREALVNALAPCTDAMDAAIRDANPQAYYRENLRFHWLFIEYAGNREIAKTYREVIQKLHLARLKKPVVRTASRTIQRRTQADRQGAARRRPRSRTPTIARRCWPTTSSTRTIGCPPCKACAGRAGPRGAIPKFRPSPFPHLPPTRKETYRESSFIPAWRRRHRPEPALRVVRRVEVPRPSHHLHRSRGARRRQRLCGPRDDQRLGQGTGCHFRGGKPERVAAA